MRVSFPCSVIKLGRLISGYCAVAALISAGAQAEFDLRDDKSNVRLFAGIVYDDSTYIDGDSERFDTSGAFSELGYQIFLNERGSFYRADGDYEIYQTERRGSDTTNMIESGFLDAEVFTARELAGWFVNYDAQALIFDSGFGSVPENRSVRTTLSTGPQSTWRITPRDKLMLRGTYSHTESSFSEIESDAYNVQANFAHAFSRYTTGSLDYLLGKVEANRYIVDEYMEERATARLTRAHKYGQIYFEGGASRLFDIDSRESINSDDELSEPSWGFGIDAAGRMGSLSLSVESDINSTADNNLLGESGSDFPSLQRRENFFEATRIKDLTNPRFLIPRFSIERRETVFLNYRSRQRGISASPKLQRLGLNLAMSYTRNQDLIQDNIPDRELLFLTASYGRPIRSAWTANFEIQRITGEGRSALTQQIFELDQTYYTVEMLYEVNSRLDMIGSVEYREFAFPSEEASSDGYLIGLEVSFRLF